MYFISILLLTTFFTSGISFATAFTSYRADSGHAQDTHESLPSREQQLSKRLLFHVRDPGKTQQQWQQSLGTKQEDTSLPEKRQPPILRRAPTSPRVLTGQDLGELEWFAHDAQTRARVNLQLTTVDLPGASIREDHEKYHRYDQVKKAFVRQMKRYLALVDGALPPEPHLQTRLDNAIETLRSACEALENNTALPVNAINRSSARTGTFYG